VHNDHSSRSPNKILFKKISNIVHDKYSTYEKNGMPLYKNLNNEDITSMEKKWSFIQTKNLYSALLHGLSYKLHDNSSELVT
jgi:hypothetical protein